MVDYWNQHLPSASDAEMDRAFHDEILNAGELPLDVLESRVMAWIARAKGKQAALAADLCELVRVQPDPAALRAFIDVDDNRWRELAAEHDDAGMTHAAQPDRVVDQGGRKLAEMSRERIAERAFMRQQPAEFEPIEPHAATVFAHVGVDAADSQPLQRDRRARTKQTIGGHAAGLLTKAATS